jgi:uncharacterized membrane protein
LLVGKGGSDVSINVNVDVDVDVDVTPEPVAPTLSAASSRPRVFQPVFSSTGLVVAAFFFALSLLPSLLPRAGYAQGVISGVTLMIGYGIGAGSQSLWDYLGIPKLTGRTRTIVLDFLVALVVGLALFAAWRQVGWQNEIRALFGIPQVSWTVWPVIIGVALLTAVLLLIVARSLRLLFRTVFGWLGRRLPYRLAVVLGGAGLLLLFWLMITGLLFNGLLSVLNSGFSTTDESTAAGIEQPQAAERSGSPASLVKWDDLGRGGRSFVASGPSVAQINEFSGGGAMEPIRAYVGLESADTPQGRADLLLAELRRAGAFEREALVVATTTGTGSLDPNGVDPIDYIFNGDDAIAGVQYSYLPSVLSLLSEQRAVGETSLAVFDTIHQYWSTLPEGSRPKLYLYGLSLGSYGVESVLNSINAINQPIDGALMSGPPFVNDLNTMIVTSRDPGSPEWLPIYRAGSTVRFTSEEGFADTPGPWGPTRIVYLQYGSDPVVNFSPSLAWERPDWLQDGRRPPDVSERMGWFPLVSMVQVAFDLPGSTSVPEGFGHLYSKKANAESWVAITNPPGWTAEKTTALTALLESQPRVGS